MGVFRLAAQAPAGLHPGRRPEAEKKRYYGDWRAYELSDHLPMWVELKIDFGEEYNGGEVQAAGVRPHVLLLTGAPGVGKTTVVRMVAERLGTGSRAGRPRIAGFYTEETRHRAGHRSGFRAVPFSGGRSRTIAEVGRPGPPRISKYGVDVAAIDALAEETLSLDDEIDLYLIDEIGKMECLSERFVAAVERLLDSNKPVVATIGKRGGGLIASAKRRPDAELWDVTTANRDAMPDRALDWLSSVLG